MGPGQQSRLVINPLESFLFSYHKDKLPHANMAYVYNSPCSPPSHLLCTKSQSGGSPATIQLTLILAHAVPDKERNLHLAWGAHHIYESHFCWCFLKIATAGFSFLSFPLFLPHISCIYKYFLTLLSFTKHAVCLFFSFPIHYWLRKLSRRRRE